MDGKELYIALITKRRKGNRKNRFRDASTKEMRRWAVLLFYGIWEQLFHSAPFFSGVYGMSRGTNANVYLNITQNGHTYELLGKTVSGYDFTAGVGIHEGLHAMEVGGSARAEALVRLAELDHVGVPINRLAMRQVLTDMGRNYDDLPWRVNKTTPYFPGLKF